MPTMRTGEPPETRKVPPMEANLNHNARLVKRGGVVCWAAATLWATPGRVVGNALGCRCPCENGAAGLCYGGRNRPCGRRA